MRSSRSRDSNCNRIFHPRVALGRVCYFIGIRCSQFSYRWCEGGRTFFFPLIREHTLLLLSVSRAIESRLRASRLDTILGLTSYGLCSEWEHREILSPITSIKSSHHRRYCNSARCDFHAEAANREWDTPNFFSTSLNRIFKSWLNITLDTFFS